MLKRYVSGLALAVVIPGLAWAQQAHPDLSGVWSYAIDRAPAALKKEVNGVVTIQKIDQSARHGDARAVPGALPSTPAPSYKPEHLARVKDLSDHESKTDPVFYCGRPGAPRIGPPRKIVQLPKETIFFYEDISGDPYRIIPTDGRPHRANANPAHYGDSVGRWDGKVFVVDARSFVDDTWFGEDGYFHSDQMRVIERFWKNGDDLVWQATVEDPVVLTAPWVMPPRLVSPSTSALEESPKCVETDGAKLLNDDHHLQR
ncbi:MAG: hypothetical protein HY824_04390 [Acidobacteria bacterium]|nr:hypothetical protein [Acidobacteriota bacterium]